MKNDLFDEALGSRLRRAGEFLASREGTPSQSQIEQAMGGGQQSVRRFTFSRSAPSNQVRRASLVVIAGVIVASTVAGVSAASRNADDGPSSEPVMPDFTVGGPPIDDITVTYLPDGFERVDDTVQTWGDGSQMHLEKYSDGSRAVDVATYRQPEPLDLGADLTFPVRVTEITVGGHNAFLLTPADGSDEIAVVEWQSGPVIVKVMGNHVSVDGVVRVARGVSIQSSG